MDARQFVSNWKAEKTSILARLGAGEGAAGARLAAAGLSAEQREHVLGAIDAALTDTLYTLLLGLDGSAQIGDDQQTYAIHDEDGNLLSDCGELEAEAYAQFHGEQA
ncbi:MAG: hypothetical protein REJ50_25805 [Bordetella sp.]|nr:hypothetical protein [Bordetella sp.]